MCDYVERRSINVQHFIWSKTRILSLSQLNILYTEQAKPSQSSHSQFSVWASRSSLPVLQRTGFHRSSTIHSIFYRAFIGIETILRNQCNKLIMTKWLLDVALSVQLDCFYATQYSTTDICSVLSTVRTTLINSYSLTHKQQSQHEINTPSDVIAFYKISWEKWQRSQHRILKRMYHTAEGQFSLIMSVLRRYHSHTDLVVS